MVNNVKELASTFFMPRQVGFAVSNGAESAIHATRQFLKSNKQCAMLKIDFRNAFNCINRNNFLKKVSELFPDILPYVNSSYANKSYLLYNQHTIFSESGVQQGDPLGPLLFSIAIQPIIDQLQSKHNIWFLDDGTICDNLEVLYKDFTFIQNESQKIGLELNINKCD